MTPPQTVGDAVRALAHHLEDAGIESAVIDARLIVGHALDLSRLAIIGHPERDVSPDQWESIQSLAGRRATDEPLAHITGEKEFWSLPFRVTSATLIPRPDSETLIDALLKVYAGSKGPRRILDIGTGSGCLLGALLSEWPGAAGVGLDVSTEAVFIARQNLKALGLSERCEIVLADWPAYQTDHPFDLVVSNPPYIPTAEIITLAPGVRDYEPHTALDGGPDGLDVHRKIADQVAGLLTLDGRIAVEFGLGQAEKIQRLYELAGFSDLQSHTDLGGRERCLLATV